MTATARLTLKNLKAWFFPDKEQGLPLHGLHFCLDTLAMDLYPAQKAQIDVCAEDIRLRRPAMDQWITSGANFR